MRVCKAIQREAKFNVPAKEGSNGSQRRIRQNSAASKVRSRAATYSRGPLRLLPPSACQKLFGQTTTGAPAGTVWLYIGTYTGNPGGGGDGEGIYLWELNLTTGKATARRRDALVCEQVGMTPSTASPSTIAIDPTGTRLYAGNEFGPPGAVSAYSINRRTGDLTLLNVQAAQGAPAYVGVDPKMAGIFLLRKFGELV